MSWSRHTAKKLSQADGRLMNPTHHLERTLRQLGHRVDEAGNEPRLENLGKNVYAKNSPMIHITHFSWPLSYAVCQLLKD